MKLTGTGVSLLAALDSGAYREAIARFESSTPGTDPVETLWRADVALYLDRLDDARAELDRLGDVYDRDLANRAQTLRAELAFWEKSLDEARELVTPVIQSTWEAGDHQGHLRATLLRARTELRRGNFVEALERLKEPQRLATVIGNDFYAGIIAHCRAYAHYYLGELKQAGHAFAEALHLLKKTESLRWDMTCRTLHAGFLSDIGRYEEALSELEFCERVALEIGLVGAALYARNNAALTLFTLGRYDEVVARLRDLLTWERATQHIFAETLGLHLLAMALGELGKFDEAEHAAVESAQLARLANNESTAFESEVIAHWAAGRAGRPEAFAEMRRLIAVADETGSDLQRCESRLYAADIVATSHPDIAATLCREAQAFPEAHDLVRIKRLVGRVEQGYSTGPVRIGVGGELILDLDKGWPDYDAAVETVKRFLVFEAVRRSNGNRSEAARKLNLTRSRLHDVWHQLHGESPRPRRTEADVTLSH
jgi:tetratricopeptide (TPR) repeat protein